MESSLEWWVCERVFNEGSSILCPKKRQPLKIVFLHIRWPNVRMAWQDIHIMTLKKSVKMLWFIQLQWTTAQIRS